MRIILITGISGSGKSVALNALEDAGYYCVDNLPPRFLPQLATYLADAGQERLAVAIDARSSVSLDEMPAMIRDLSREHDVRVLFLNASTQSLIQRFSETRRRHPLSGSTAHDADVGLLSSLEEAIERERELVAGLAEFGHQIDTSNLRANLLRAWVKRFIEQEQRAGLALMFESFGFKRGVPLDADFVFDVRTLPNPYYDHLLRPLTGRDQPVIDFLSALPVVQEMIGDIQAFLVKWLAAFPRRQPQLSDGRHRLYRRTAPVRVYRGNACRASLRRGERYRPAPRCARRCWRPLQADDLTSRVARL